VPGPRPGQSLRPEAADQRRLRGGRGAARFLGVCPAGATGRPPDGCGRQARPELRAGTELLEMGWRLPAHLVAFPGRPALRRPVPWSGASRRHRSPSRPARRGRSRRRRASPRARRRARGRPRPTPARPLDVRFAPRALSARAALSVNRASGQTASATAL